MLEKVYGEAVLQEQEKSVDNQTNLIPWIVGGGVFLVGGLILFQLIRKSKKVKGRKK